MLDLLLQSSRSIKLANLGIAGSFVMMMTPLLQACEGSEAGITDGSESIAPSHRQCEKDAECVVVSVDCDACCTRGAVSVVSHDTYEAERTAGCPTDADPSCDCSSSVIAHCNEGLCAVRGEHESDSDPNDPCQSLQGTWDSVEPLTTDHLGNPVGYNLVFKSSTILATLGDYGFAYDYTCRNGGITATTTFPGADTSGTIEDGKLIFRGAEYRR